MENKMRRKKENVNIEALERKIENQKIKDSMKYKHHIHKLGKLEIELKDTDKVWVYLQSFDDDEILDGRFVYNYGVMNEEMKEAIGKVLDYGIYKQTIVEMDFATFKDFYEENRLKIDLLDAKYPGIAI